MKGIILAGGTGTRLYPITKSLSKQMIPVYDKPMIYYPLSVLMLSEIREILIISTPHDLILYKKLLGDGSNYGIKLSYAIQENANGLASAFIIGEKFIGNDNVCLILGDNLFYGRGFSRLLSRAKEEVEINQNAVIFGFNVNDPERYGVVEVDDNFKAISIVEKPSEPKSNLAVVGLYFYPNSVVEISKSIRPSERNEYEISSVNQLFLDQNNLNVEYLGRGFAWFDTGTNESLFEAAEFIRIIQKRQGLMVACLEEIAFKKGWISKKILQTHADIMNKTSYGKYILKLLNEN